MKKLFLVVFLLAFASCKEEITLEFTETAIEKKDPVSIQVIYPKLESYSDVALKINKSVDLTIAKNIAFFEENTDGLTLNDAISQIENRYINFRNDFQDDALPWEITINSEVVYQSSSIITIAVDSYAFTGGAHGNSTITLLNFDPDSGKLYQQTELFSTSIDFMQLVEGSFKSEIKSQNKNEEDYFFGQDFKLPENVGFSDEGVIFLYITYELASYAQGITEFTIPYSDISTFLKISH